MELLIEPPFWRITLNGELLQFDFSNLVDDAELETIRWNGEKLLGTKTSRILVGTAVCGTVTRSFRDPAVIWPFVTAFHDEKVRLAKLAAEAANTAVTLAGHRQQDAQIDLHDQNIRAQRRDEKRAATQHGAGGGGGASTRVGVYNIVPRPTDTAGVVPSLTPWSAQFLAGGAVRFSDYPVVYQYTPPGGVGSTDDALVANATVDQKAAAVATVDAAISQADAALDRLDDALRGLKETLAAA